MDQQKVTTIAYSSQGAEISLALLEKLRAKGYFCDGFLFEKYQCQGLVPFHRAEEIISRCFQERSGIIFFCAMGIAVRQISSFIQSKQTDSAVLVMDEMGKFVIPVLSGHMGGANELAAVCAEFTGAVPVITTATDLHGRFAVDVFAVKNHLLIDNMKLAKEVSASILHAQTIPVYLEECYAKEKPDRTELMLISREIHREGMSGSRGMTGENQCIVRRTEERAEKPAENGPDMRERKLGILISPYCRSKGAELLHLIPKQIILGVGCRKGIATEAIESAVFAVLEEYQIDRRALCRICTIDRKKEEPGLVAFCRRQGIPMQTFGREELALQEGEFTGSAFVYETAGVDNVCERSAMAGGGERLIVRKQKRDGVTVAAAACRMGLDFN